MDPKTKREAEVAIWKATQMAKNADTYASRAFQWSGMADQYASDAHAFRKEAARLRALLPTLPD